MKSTYCKCTNCGNKWKDEGNDRPELVLHHDGGETYWACPECSTDEHLMDLTIGKYKQPCDTMYHIFSNGYDDYISDAEKVIEEINRMVKDKGEHQNIRVYKQTEWDEDEGIFLDGDCIFSLEN